MQKALRGPSSLLRQLEEERAMRQQLESQLAVAMQMLR